MSLHNSLKGTGATASKRNVLKRSERIKLMQKRGQWQTSTRALALPKTKPEA